jgi:hypothetical protein
MTRAYQNYPLFTLAFITGFPGHHPELVKTKVIYKIII